MAERRRLLTVSLFALYLNHVRAENPTPTKDYYSPLQSLDPPFSGSVYGGQNFKLCCLKAVKEWKDDPKSPDITIESSKNKGLTFTNPDDPLLAAEQFPCGAEYDDDEDGATRVKITYSWCRSNCPGWQRSKNSVLTQWLQPFIGFILPAAVFCLNVRCPHVKNVYPADHDQGT